MIFIGIDPGSKGAMSIIKDGDVIASCVFDEWSYIHTLSNYNLLDGAFAVVEKVHAMPGQGVTSMFSFGHNLGEIEGMLMAMKIQYQLVSPQTWKREFGLLLPKGTDKSKIKQASISCVEKMFPNANLLATPRCRSKHDGIAESILMAEYARRIYR